jgi:hypothetical protein
MMMIDLHHCNNAKEANDESFSKQGLNVEWTGCKIIRNDKISMIRNTESPLGNIVSAASSDSSTKCINKPNKLFQKTFA